MNHKSRSFELRNNHSLIFNWEKIKIENKFYVSSHDFFFFLSPVCVLQSSAVEHGLRKNKVPLGTLWGLETYCSRKCKHDRAKSKVMQSTVC